MSFARRIVGAATLLALCACQGTDGLPQGRLGAAFFPAQIDGHATVTQGGTPGSGSRIDLADDLDLENDFLGTANLELDDGRLRLGLGYLPFAFEGRDTLTRDLVFHGTTFNAGDDVASTLDFETWNARVDGALIQDSEFELRVGGGAYWWDFQLELEDKTAAVTDARKFERLLPAVTTTAWLALGAGFATRFDGAFATLDEGRRLVDATAQVEYLFDERLRAVVGWRWLRYWLNEDTNTGMIDISGPLLGLTLRL